MIMGPRSSIGHFTVCKDLAIVRMGESSSIGRANWISGYPSRGTDFFAAFPNRSPELTLGEHAAITHRHLVDCTDRITVGAFATVAGYRSQILTHSIDVHRNRQGCAPVAIGAYTFVGTQCIVLGGARLPDFSALAAGSLLTKDERTSHMLYGGVPARAIRPLPDDAGYFTRQVGRVN